MTMQQRLTDALVDCPTCGTKMVGARVFDTEAQEAYVGLACTTCDVAYRPQLVMAAGTIPDS